MTGMDTSLSALHAFATGTHGTAYNIANINTGGFRPVSVRYRSGVPDDQGVRPVVTREAAPAAGELTGPTAPSGTEPAREMVNLIVNQRSFEANAAVIRTDDALLGTIIDLIA